MSGGFGTIDQVIAKLNQAITQIEERTMAGLLEAAAFLRYDMDTTPPLIPVGKTENLRLSWTATGVYNKGRPTVICGFTANYARWVHDNVGAKFTRPGSGANFFSAALNRNHKVILKIIRDKAKI